MKSLFPTTAEPVVTTVDVTDLPMPGPNAFAAAELSYDPDVNRLVVCLPNDVQAVFELSDMGDSSSFEILLLDSKLGPKVTITVTPRTPMPKFSSPEEADAWLEANS